MDNWFIIIGYERYLYNPEMQLIKSKERQIKHFLNGYKTRTINECILKITIKNGRAGCTLRNDNALSKKHFIYLDELMYIDNSYQVVKS